MNDIILASSSIYRKQLLEKTGLQFTTEKPLFDEDLAKEKLLSEKKIALEIAETLSRAKAEAVLKNRVNKSVLIISGDQLVHFDGQIIGKSKNFEKAFEQLEMMNHKTHELITAVTLLKYDHSTQKKKILHLNHITTLKMKKLKDKEITAYLKKDTPFDCAGSYKIESSGLILFEKIDCDDFSAIQGLPLLWITKQLQELGYEFFKN